MECRSAAERQIFKNSVLFSLCAFMIAQTLIKPDSCKTVSMQPGDLEVNAKLLTCVVAFALMSSARANFVDERSGAADRPGSATPSAAAVPATTTPAKPSYVLTTGEPIHVDLKAWATREGWDLYWHPTVSWRTLRGATFDHASLTGAVTEVVDILRGEGKPIRLRISEGNKVMEVISTEVRND